MLSLPKDNKTGIKLYRSLKTILFQIEDKLQILKSIKLFKLIHNVERNRNQSSILIKNLQTLRIAGRQVKGINKPVSKVLSCKT